MSTLVNGLFAFLLAALWQSTAIVLLVWLALKCIPRVNATTRYAVWFAALIVLLVLPALTSQHAPSASTVSEATRVTSTRAVPFVASVEQNVPVPAFHVVPALRLNVLPAIANAVVFAWIGATAFFLIRLTLSLIYLERLKRNSLPVEPAVRAGLRRWNAAVKGDRDVRLCVSDAIGVPVAIGLFDSMILLPSDYLALDPNELDYVLLHELAHLRRCDDWTNALQRVASAFLFFSPAVAFACTRLDVEREVACDDDVLRVEPDPLLYANCLARIARLAAWPQRDVAAPGIFMTRRGTSVRVERLLDGARDRGLRILPIPFTAAMLAFCLVVGAAVFAAPALTFASPTGDAPVTDSTAHAGSQIAFTGDWDIKAWPKPPTEASGAPPRRADFFAPVPADVSSIAPAINLSLHYPISASNTSARVSLAQLGIEPAALQGDGRRVHFALRYDAGTFVCDGTANRGLAKGTFEFLPDQTYVQKFGALRGASLTPRQIVMAGMFDLQLSYVEVLGASGLREVSFDDLVGLKMFGVTAADVKMVHEDFPSADASLITGVRMTKGDPADIHALHLLLPAAGLEMVIGLQTIGVTPAFVSSLQKAEVRDLTADNTAALKVAGVDQTLADLLASQGPRGLSIDEIVRLAKQRQREASP
ncbi:MAG TPA: M56 family metallopeptidase [Candidatus Acidoferrales bacterium]|jgi:beta-lactamase regulating signal transducer with metallopeptidase domain|nr:M56 family metallopeptidase [Candidatus Acidoferrales bacterium]